MKKLFILSAVSAFALMSCRSGSHGPGCEAYGGGAPSVSKKAPAQKAAMKMTKIVRIKW